MPHNTIPDDPSLSGEGLTARGLVNVVFGSVDGAVRTVAPSPGAQFLPSSDGAAVPRGGGTWMARDTTRPLELTFAGTKSGTYSQTYTASGFVASARAVRTARGVKDVVRGARGSLRFDSGVDRPLQLELARQESAGSTIAATLDTHASAQGSDTGGISADGTLTYAHEGAPTTVRILLNTVRREGGPATFSSGPLHVGRGVRLRVKPLGRDLRRVRLVLRDAQGRRSTRVLRSRSRARTHLTLSAPRISGRRLSIPLRLVGHHSQAVFGATLRLMRGGRLIANKAVALKTATGARKVAWRLPRRVEPGTYRLLTDVRAIGVGARGSTVAGSVSAHREARIHVGR
jgi:hypothetical protein